jgi:uncharacterized protein YwqG
MSNSSVGYQAQETKKICTSQSTESQRRQLENKIISKYKPICNQINDDEQDTYNTTVRTTEPEPEPEPDSESDV